MNLAKLQKSHLNLAKYFHYAVCPDVFRFKVGFYQHSSLYFVCRYVLRSFRKLSAHSFRCVALFPATTAFPHSLELWDNRLTPGKWWCIYTVHVFVGGGIVSHSPIFSNSASSRDHVCAIWLLCPSNAGPMITNMNELDPSSFDGAMSDISHLCK